jgi:hypothetical protein
MACCVAAEKILTERPILASVNSKLLEKVGTYLSPVRDTQGHERSWGVSPMRQHCPSTTLSTIGARRSSIRLRTPPPGIRGDEAVAPLRLAINRPAKRSSPIIRPHGLYATTTTAGDRFARNGGGSPGSRTCRSPTCGGSPRPSSQSSKWMATATGREPPAEGPLAANSRGERLLVASAASWRGIYPVGFPSERKPWQKAPDMCAHFGKRLPTRG